MTLDAWLSPIAQPEVMGVTMAAAMIGLYVVLPLMLVYGLWKHNGEKEE